MLCPTAVESNRHASIREDRYRAVRVARERATFPTPVSSGRAAARRNSAIRSGCASVAPDAVSTARVAWRVAPPSDRAPEIHPATHCDGEAILAINRAGTPGVSLLSPATLAEFLALPTAVHIALI